MFGCMARPVPPHLNFLLAIIEKHISLPFKPFCNIEFRYSLPFWFVEKEMFLNLYLFNIVHNCECYFMSEFIQKSERKCLLIMWGKMCLRVVF